MLDVHVIETPSLGDRSYVATDGTVAVVVDPQRDLDRVLAVTEPRGLRISHVLETHVHNDYVTGGCALARETGAEYCLDATEQVSYQRRGLRDGDRIDTGELTVRVLATPGHTFGHLAYVVAGAGRTAVFSGGSLLRGGTGRTDLLGEEHTLDLARRQHESVRRLVDAVPADAQLCPTHGFGSFCSSGAATTTGTTVADQLAANPALLLERDAYVAQLVASLGPYPAYYARMSSLNRSGPGRPDLGPVSAADPRELARRLEAGEWVVDLRTRTAFAAQHVPGTVNVGVDGSFATWIGWLVPEGAAITLLAATAADVADGQRELVRIGVERPDAAATGGPRAWSAGGRVQGYPVCGFGDLAVRLGHGAAPYVLDVRLPQEHTDAHVAGSVNIPLPELRDRVAEVPADREVWVHCGMGYRAAIACSLLRREGRVVVLVDGEFSGAGAAGVPLAA